MTSAFAAKNITYCCDLHPQFDAYIIADCEQLHRLCAQCIYLISVSEAEQSGGIKQMLCPICKQTIRNFEELANNEEEITKAFLNMNITKKMRVDMPKLQLADELHVELMHFLDMESLQKMLLVSRLPYAYFGKQLRKWKASNEWIYPTQLFGIGDELTEAIQHDLCEISQHGHSVCKGNAPCFANVRAEKPFKLATLTDHSSATAVLRFYFEIRVNKSTGPILFGLVQSKFDLGAAWDFRMQEEYFARRLAEHQMHETECHEQILSFIKKQGQHFLANDIAAWPMPMLDSEWEEQCLEFFARQSLVPTTADGKFTDGEVLGCGLLLFPQQKMLESVQEEGTNGTTTDDAVARNCQLLFTKNGHLIGEPTWLSPVYGDELFPFVGLVSEGTNVTGNFGDIEKFPLLYNTGQHNSPIDTE